MLGGNFEMGSGFTMEKLEKAQQAAETLPEKCSDHRGMFSLVAQRGG